MCIPVETTLVSYHCVTNHSQTSVAKAQSLLFLTDLWVGCGFCGPCLLYLTLDSIIHQSAVNLNLWLETDKMSLGAP